MQEPKSDRDGEYEEKINRYMNNPAAESSMDAVDSQAQLIASRARAAPSAAPSAVPKPHIVPGASHAKAAAPAPSAVPAPTPAPSAAQAQTPAQTPAHAPATPVPDRLTHLQNILAEIGVNKRSGKTQPHPLLTRLIHVLTGESD